MIIHSMKLVQEEDLSSTFSMVFYVTGENEEFIYYKSPPFLIDDYHAVYEEYRQQALDYATTADK